MTIHCVIIDNNWVSEYSPEGDEISNIRNLVLTELTPGGEYILLMPCYEGSELRLETLTLDSNNVAAADEIIQSIEFTPGNYGLLVNTNLSEGIPQFQATVIYDGRETSYQFSEKNLAGHPYPFIMKQPDLHYVEYYPYNNSPFSTVSIYFPDEQVMYFEVEQAELLAFTPGALITALIEKDLLPSGTQVLNFSTYEADGKKLIDLDLSTEYYQRLTSLGTSGEFAVIGSICNTFLNAYKADLIKITTDGSSYETGHAYYEDYLEFQ